MFHNSFNFVLNHLKFWNWKHQFIFFKTLRLRSNSRWCHQPLFYTLYLHSPFLTNFNTWTHFGLAILSNCIFLRFKIIQFKMESLLKMAILRLSIRSLSIFAILRPTIFKFWILIENYTKINDTFGYLWFTIRSEIELGLEPSQIKIFYIIFHDF
jgi:hypothetical protein